MRAISLDARVELLAQKRWEKTEKELDQLKNATAENQMLPIDQSADLPSGDQRHSYANPLCVPSVNDLSCACQTASVRSC
jgi:hypothetical protein